MSARDRERWDERHAARASLPLDAVSPPSAFADRCDGWPTAGHAVDVACGVGTASVWMARRGLDVVGVDVSPRAIERARDVADRSGVAPRCRFAVVDLDAGLPPGPLAEVVLVHLFNAPALDGALVARLAPGGLLAVAVLSEVGAEPGRFRARPGELLERFGADAALDVLDAGEGDGVARLLARRR